MASLNKVILIGRLGKDPHIVQSQSGKFANLTLATSESWKDKQTGERKERTEWHNLVLNTTQLAEFAERYLQKGNQIYAEGQLRTREWTDQNGIKKYVTEVICGGFNGKIMLLEAKKDNEQTEEVTQDLLDDDIPF